MVTKDFCLQTQLLQMVGAFFLIFGRQVQPTGAFLEKLARNTSKRRKRIAELLRNVRKELGLTQAEVAEVLGWNQTAVSKMEAGDLTPDVIDLENFAGMCGKTLNDFATWYAQCEEDRAKQSLGLAADKFQRRVAAVRRRKRNRIYWKGRKVTPTAPVDYPPRSASETLNSPQLGLAIEAFQRAMAEKRQRRRKNKQGVRRRAPKPTFNPPPQGS